jgi:hypothetical protein
MTPIWQKREREKIDRERKKNKIKIRETKKCVNHNKQK